MEGRHDPLRGVVQPEPGHLCDPTQPVPERVGVHLQGPRRLSDVAEVVQVGAQGLQQDPTTLVVSCDQRFQPALLQVGPFAEHVKQLEEIRVRTDVVELRNVVAGVLAQQHTHGAVGFRA